MREKLAACDRGDIPGGCWSPSHLSLLLLKQEEQTLTRQETAGLAWGKQLDWGPSMKGTGRGQMFSARLGVPRLLGLGVRPTEGALGCAGQ